MKITKTQMANFRNKLFIVVADTSEYNPKEPGLPVYKIAVLENANDRTWDFIQRPGEFGEEDIKFYSQKEATVYLLKMYASPPDPEKPKLRIIK